MTKTLTIVKTDGEKLKPTREKVHYLEMPPREEWFHRATTPRGRELWFLRFSMSGLYPRLYGPFSSKRTAVLFLDGAVGKFMDCWSEFDDVWDRYKIEQEFQFVHWAPLIEHAVVTNRQATSKKGR